MYRRRTGFTLIELLVVIAIIAILAAILFPVFARARAKAQQTTCLSNVKQITLGVLMYAEDYKQYLPEARIGWGWGDWWGALVYPYVQNLGIFHCPTDDITTAAAAPGSFEPNDLHVNGWSYGYNMGLGTWVMLPHHPSPTNLGQVQNPSNLLLLTDAGFYMLIWTWDWGHCPNCDERARHNNGMNVGLSDGHAEWMNPNTLHACVYWG